MTREEALIEAKKRWGGNAVIREDPAGFPDPCPTFQVQSGPVTEPGIIWGAGFTWESAFAHADKGRKP